MHLTMLCSPSNNFQKKKRESLFSHIYKFLVIGFIAKFFEDLELF